MDKDTHIYLVNSIVLVYLSLPDLHWYKRLKRINLELDDENF